MLTSRFHHQLHVMIDLETLDTRPEAVIIELGAVVFEPYPTGLIVDEFCTLVSVTEQVRDRRTIEDSTLMFWFAQDTSRFTTSGARLDHKPTLEEALSAFHNWYHGQRAPISRVWSHGAAFDIPILQSAYASFGRPTPWAYRDVLCTRTLFQLTDADNSKVKPHNALEDARLQAQRVQRLLP